MADREMTVAELDQAIQEKMAERAQLSREQKRLAALRDLRAKEGEVDALTAETDELASKLAEAEAQDYEYRLAIAGIAPVGIPSEEKFGLRDLWRRLKGA